MADISSYTSAILTAIYGRDVRQSLVNALNKVNDDNNSYQAIKTEILKAKSDIEVKVVEFKTAVDNAVAVEGNLKAAVNSANSARDELLTTIANSSSSKSNLETAIRNAATSKNDLELAITNANKAKTAAENAKKNLDASVSNANIVKTNLDNSISAATTLKTNLDNSIDAGNTLEHNLDVSINDANVMKKQLSEVIVNSGTAKTQLSDVIADAGRVKSELLAVIGQGNAAIENAKDAAEKAYAAATNADNKATAANAATTAANSATEKANKAAINADNKATAANSAATAANDAAATAAAAAENANNKATAANAATVAANSASERANTAATNADNKATAATNAASQAITAKNSAVQAANNANTATEAADNATERANAAAKAAEDVVAGTGLVTSAEKGVAGGVAELDAQGKVPASQLPSFVDDVLEYPGVNKFPSTGEAGKIYIDVVSNRTFRWSGTQYTEISPSITLGETAATAYRGDRGKVAYDHSQAAHARADATNTSKSSTNGNIKINGAETVVYNHPGSGTNPHGTTKSDVGLSNVPNVATNDQTPTYTATTSLVSLTSGEKLSVAFGKIARAIMSLISHIGSTANPHTVTKSQVGLGNVDNVQQATKTEFNNHNGDNTRHISSAERTAWNNKAGTATATQTSNGLMSSADKVKLDGVEKNANKYTHPSSHAASMITQDSTRRFVSDTEKNTWNAKLNAIGNIKSLASQTKSVASGVTTTIDSYTFTVSGVYLVFAKMAAHALPVSAYKLSYIIYDGNQYISEDSMQSAGLYRAALGGIVMAESGKKVELKFEHDSGSSYNATGGLQIARIK